MIHICTQEEKDGKYVWTCPLCPDYQRTWDSKTHEMSVRGCNEHNHYGGTKTAGHILIRSKFRIRQVHPMDN